MPNTTPEIWRQIGASGDEILWESAGKFGVLSPAVTVLKGEVIFPRIDIEKEIEELNKVLEAAKSAEKAPESADIKLSDEITIDDFARVELRVAKVIKCEAVPKSDKLLCLHLDDGMGGRQVASGISKWYKPEDLTGKKVIVVANLKPVKLRGVESQGMICAADMPDGSAKVIFPDDSIPVGSKIR